MCRVHKPQAIRRRIIEDYFAQHDLRHGVYAVTGVGEFVPSSLSRVYRGLMQLMDEGLIGRDATFLDAGSGDGRVVVLTSFVLGLMSYGVEYDETLWQRSLTNINFFRRFYQDAAHLPMVLWGDFCDEETYTRFGMRFTVFDVVFDYASNHHKLAQKITRDAKDDVLFVYYGPNAFAESFSGLCAIRSLSLGNPCASTQSFLHVYRKQRP